MESTEALHKRILAWVLDTFPLARQHDIGIDENLLDGGIIDSMGTLEVVQFIEDQYAVVVEDEEMVADHFSSVRAIAEYIQSKL